MVAISPAWRSPLRSGRPDTTISTDRTTSHTQVEQSLCSTACLKNGKLTGIADGLHFVHVKVVNNAVKADVKVIEEVHHLEGSAGTGNLGKPNNVTEVDGDAVKRFSCNVLPMFQLLSNLFWQHTLGEETHMSDQRNHTQHIYC